jgi:hypothetical protein
VPGNTHTEQHQNQQYLESLVSGDSVVSAWRTLLEPDARLLIRTFPEVEAMAHAKDYGGAIVALQSIVGSFATLTEEEILGYDGATYDLTRALLELGSLYFATGQVIFITTLIPLTSVPNRTRVRVLKYKPSLALTVTTTTTTTTTTAHP